MAKTSQPALAQLPAKRGRPTKFTPEKADIIILGLSEGTPLTVICAEHAIGLRAVYDWMDADADFSASIARARDTGHDKIARDALEISDTPEIGVETITKADGSIETREGDMLGHRKLRVETRLKLLAKWDPKRYGDKQEVKHSGTVGLEHWVLDAMGQAKEPAGEGS